MTNKEIIMNYKRAAKRACKENGIHVNLKDMILLETGFDGIIIDYVMFKDAKSKIEYQCYYGAKYYNPETDSLWYVERYN